MTINMAVPFTLVLLVLSFAILGCGDLHVHLSLGQCSPANEEVLVITTEEVSNAELEIEND